MNTFKSEKGFYLRPLIYSSEMSEEENFKNLADGVVENMMIMVRTIENDKGLLMNIHLKDLYSYVQPKLAAWADYPPRVPK